MDGSVSEPAGQTEDSVGRGSSRGWLGQAALIAIVTLFFVGAYTYMVVSGTPLFSWGALEGFFADNTAAIIGVIVSYVALFVMIGILALFPDDMIRESRSEDDWSVSYIRSYFAVMMFGFGMLALAVVLLLLHQNGWEFSGPEGSATPATPRQVALLPAWHALEVAPFVDVNGTVGWEEPAGYDQPFVGVLLLILKLGVVLVVAEGIRGALRKLRS